MSNYETKRPMLALQGLRCELGKPGNNDRFRLVIQELMLYAGQLLCVFGPTGIGKSTLLRLLGLAQKPTSVETFLILERIGSFLPEKIHDIAHLWRKSRQADIARLRLRLLAFALQFPELFPSLTVRENIEIPLRLNNIRVNPEELADLLRALSCSPDDLDLFRRQHYRPHQLSGGQKQRAGLGRAFVHRPKLLLADEPTSNLDRETAKRAMDVINHLRSTYGTAVILVSHDESLARDYADRIIRLEKDAHGYSTIVEEEQITPCHDEDFGSGLLEEMES